MLNTKETKTIWKDAEGKRIDNAKINNLLSFLIRLECEKYINDAKKEYFKNPAYVVTLKGTKEYSLSIFAKKDKDDKNYPAISSESDYPFLLSDSQVDSVKSKIEEIVEVKKK